MKKNEPVFDMRIRPSFLHRFFGSTRGTPEYETVRWLNKRVGSMDAEHFSVSDSIERLLNEMDEAGIPIGVMVGRSTPTVRVKNEELADISMKSKGRLLTVASVDPVQLGKDDAVAEVRRVITELGAVGLNIDAGFYSVGLKANADLLMPLYEVCDQLEVPAFIMSGPTTPNLELNDPWAVDAVARTFPNLKIVCSHGFYPRVLDIVTVAFRNENVFVSPDMYMFSPGGEIYIAAANGFMRDQYVFGTSYPFRAMKQSVHDLHRAGLQPEQLKKVCYENACRIFGVDPKRLNKGVAKSGKTMQKT